MGFASLYPSCEVRGVRGASFTGIRGEGTVAPATGSGSLVGKVHPTCYPDPVFEPPPAPMIAAVRPMTVQLAGGALLLMGSGLLGGLLVVRVAAEGFGAQKLGLVVSAFFVGFRAGTCVAPGLIAGLGLFPNYLF